MKLAMCRRRWIRGLAKWASAAARQHRHRVAVPAIAVAFFGLAGASCAEDLGPIRPSEAIAPTAQRAVAEGPVAKLDLGFEGVIGILEDESGEGAEIVTDELSSRRVGGSANSVSLGRAEIQFQGGNASQRTVRVIDDPERSGNRVLEFMLRSPNVRQEGRTGVKSRIQMNVYSNRGIAEVYQSVRLRLGPDFELLQRFDQAFDWFTISEWWNNAGWTREPFAFRISVNISKPRRGTATDLNFSAKAQAKSAAGTDFDVPVWQQSKPDFHVPIGRWMTLEYYFKEGDAKNGRFVMAVTPEGGQRVVVVDVKGFTRHPDARQDDGLRHFNPIKLYTSTPLTEFVRTHGGALQMLWDDISILGCGKTTPPDVSACARQAGLR